MKINIYINITIIRKKIDNYWYINIVAVIYITHNPCYYIIIDLYLVYKLLKIADDCKI